MAKRACPAEQRLWALTHPERGAQRTMAARETRRGLGERRLDYLAGGYDLVETIGFNTKQRT